MTYGAFVEILPGKDGLLHISEISWERLESMDGLFKEGDIIQVKLIEIDKKTGKFRLSMRALLPKPEGYVEPERPARPPRRDGDRQRLDYALLLPDRAGRAAPDLVPLSAAVRPFGAGPHDRLSDHFGVEAAFSFA